MASIHKEIPIDAPPEMVWAALRDVGAAHVRLFPGLLVDTRLEEGARIVTFANGMTVRELIIDIDDASRRLSFAAVGGRIVHHQGSMQVFADGNGGSRLSWTTDVLPDELAGSAQQNMDMGAGIVKKTLEQACSGAAG
jgi:carbon monoxide dehydrogenase subunit G